MSIDPKNNSGTILMPSETFQYFKESLAEIKADLKEIKKQQQDHEKELVMLKYKMLLLAGVGGGGAHYGLKLLGF